MVAFTTALLSTALVLTPGRPSCRRVHARTFRRAVTITADMANDGEAVDWDKEAAALVASGGGRAEDNPYYKAIKAIAPPELVNEFAQTAPRDVQIAIRATIGQMLGNMPPQALESEITTSGKNLGSLMFSMQMTGYMFRNAEYRRSLAASIESSERSSEQSSLTVGDQSSPSLPPVSGKVRVKIAEGMEAEVDAAAYMAELRNEVEGLRTELTQAREKQEEGDKGGGLISFVQALEPTEAQDLTSGVSQDVLVAMSQLVSSLLIDMNIPYDDRAAVTASSQKLRELLTTQLVSGYKLRELEVREEIKDKFWS